MRETPAFTFLGAQDYLDRVCEEKEQEAKREKTISKKIEFYKYKLEMANKLIADMRFNYLKETSILRDQLFVAGHLTNNNNSYIDIKYFDGSHLVNDEVRDFINLKVKEIKDKY